MTSLPTPARPTRLRRHLTLAFGAFATVPLLLVLVAQDRVRERMLTQGVDALAERQAALVRDAGARAVDLTVAGLAADAGRLAAIAPAAERRAAVRADLQPRLDAAAHEAEIAMAAAAHELHADLRRQALMAAAGMLLTALLAGLAAGRWLSARIADPIDQAERLREAELDRRGQELAIASRLQQALLPEAPHLPGFDVAVGTVPAAEVGGDLLDVIATGGDGFWLAIGDVTGHGLTPGLIMMMAQSLFTGFVTADPTAAPRRVLTDLNRALHLNIRDRLRHDAFMTLMLLKHEGDGAFVACGLHCDVLIRRAATGRVEAVEVGGCWAGLLPEIGDLIPEQRFRLDPGDTLLLYSDGLIEARDAGKAQFDTAGLVRTLGAAAAAGDGVLPTYQRIMGAVEAWQATRADDLSLLVLQRHAPSPVPAGVLPQVVHA